MLKSDLIMPIKEVFNYHTLGDRMPRVERGTDLYYILPVSPEITQIRRAISGSRGTIVDIPGVTLVATEYYRYSLIGESESCIDYIFPRVRSNPLINPINSLICYRDPVPEALGTIAVYFDDYGNFTHVGKVVENGIIESKFGLGNVYRHKKEYVPKGYGSMIIFF